MSAFYQIEPPEGGFRPKDSFSREEHEKLRPIAETLAMLDGNAFFGNMLDNSTTWWSDQYTPEAYAFYEANGGDKGWAGEASFIRHLLPSPPLFTSRSEDDDCKCLHRVRAS